MCGIFGYVNYLVEKKRGEIIDIIISGLKQLEYRGYDSAGLCIEGDKPGELFIFKAVGKVQLLRDKVDKAPIDKEKTFMCHSGMSHTRWATHGVPSERNCHPHRSDKTNEFVVVHNGMLTNYNKIRTYLEKHGYAFESDTDTEAIAKLLKFLNDAEPNQTFDVLLKKMLAIVEGSLAIIVKSTHFPDAVAAVRRGSPLVIGIKAQKEMKEVPVHRSEINLMKPGDEDKVLDALADGRSHPNLSRKGTASAGNLLAVPAGGDSMARAPSSPDLLGPDPGLYRTKSTAFMTDDDQPIPIEFFIASDASPIVEHTKQVIYLEDYDVAVMSDGELHVHVARPKTHEEKVKELLGQQPKPVPKPAPKPEVPKGVVQTLELEVSRIKKGDFDHYMKKEIHEQPDSMMDTMRGRVNFQEYKVRLGGLVKELDRIKKARRMIFIACGTSYHSAIATQALFEELTELPCTVEIASNFLDRKAPIFSTDVCVYISQSGETKDTLNCLNYCKEKGALCVGIVNTVGSSISIATHCGVHVNAGPEIGVASTKAYTSQFITLVMMAIMISEDNPKKAARRKEIIDALLHLPEQARRVLALDVDIKTMSSQYYPKDKDRNTVIIGRGHQFATCLEGALKIKEITYMATDGVQAGELKHGPMALIEPKLGIILVMTDNSLYPEAESAFEQVRARGGQPIILCNEGDKRIPGACTPLGWLESLLPSDAGFGKKQRSDWMGARALRIPKTVDALEGILTVIPLQLMAYHIAVNQGKDPDNPRNLAKSVTV